MRDHTAQLAQAVTQGSFTRELVADVYYGPGNRTLQDLPLNDWTLTGDYDAKIKTGATCIATYQGDFAESLTPREFTDALAPAGQELRVYMLISAGEFRERIPVGVYRIDDVPNAVDYTTPFQGRTFTTGSVVELSLLDRMSTLDFPFRSLEQPVSLTSAWAEIARLSRLPITRNVPDVSIPYSIVYSRNKLEAVQQLAALLGGRAAMFADGTLGLIPDEPGDPVLELKIGEDEGTVISAGYYLSAADLRNCVIGDFEDENGQPIHAEAAITSGPLSVDGPMGERAVEYPDDQKEFIRTQQAAQNAVNNHLLKVSARGPFEIPVQTVPDPRPEIGDVITVQRPSGSITGRVVKYTHSRSGEMQLTVRSAAS